MGQNDIQATMGLDTASFKKGADKIVGDVRGMAGEMTSALGVGLSVGSTVAIVSGLVEKLHTMSLTAKRIDMKPEKLQGYAYAAKMTGLELDDISRAFMRIKQEANKAMSGNGDSFWMFKNMGVDVENLEKMDVDGRFKLIAGSLAKMTDKVKQETYAQEIFGKQWQAILPFIKEYGSLIEEFNGRKLGVSGKDFEAADKIAHGFDKLKMAAESIIINSGFLRDLDKIANIIDKASAFATSNIGQTAVQTTYESARGGVLSTLGAGGQALDIFLRICNVLEKRLPGEENAVDRSQ